MLNKKERMPRVQAPMLKPSPRRLARPSVASSEVGLREWITLETWDPSECDGLEVRAPT